MCAYGFQQRLIIASGKRYFLSLQEVTIGNIMEGISCEFRRNYKVCQYVRNDCCHLSVIFHALSFFFVMCGDHLIAGKHKAERWVVVIAILVLMVLFVGSLFYKNWYE